MFLLIYKGHTAVLLLYFTLHLVFASSNNVDNNNLTLAEIADCCVNIPWIGGLDWVINSPGSLRGEKIRTFIRGVDASEEWAMQMLDALLKIESEIPRDRSQNLRNNEDCLKVEARYDDITVHDNWCGMVSRDHEFMTDGNSDGSSTLTCEKSANDEIEELKIAGDSVLSNIMNDESHSGGNSFSQAGVKPKDFTTAEISAISVFLAIGTFLIACTFCDIVRRTGRCGSTSSTVITLSKLSLYTNALAILSTKVTPDMMPAIHGMRCVSCFFVILGHRFGTSLGVYAQKVTLVEYLEIKASWTGLVVTMTPFAVDTFLLVSGFFTSYLYFKAVQSGVKINWPSMYLLRYFRLTPGVATVVLFAAVLSHRLGSGPLWETIFENSINHCRDTWWIYLLHFQNLVKNGMQCIPHGWYPALDMQLFWISPFILYPLNRWPKFGLRLLISLLILSAVGPAILLVANGYSNSVLRLDTELLKMMDNVENFYMPTYIRASPYFIGILLGYDLATTKRRLSLVNVMFNWIVAASFILLGAWATARTYSSNFAYNLGIELIFTAISRPGWSMAMAWVLYACTQGYGGLATWFLSLPVFFPLSRLAYSIYLVHYAVQGISYGGSSAPMYYLGFDMVLRLFLDIVISIALGFVFNLFVESPIIALTKIFASRGKRRSDTVPKSTKTGKTATKS